MNFIKKYMFQLLIASVLVGNMHNLFSEEITNKSKTNLSSVYFELAGQGPFFSINYDKSYYYRINFRGGIGAIITPLSSYYTFPIGINYLVGNKNIFETGVGITPWLSMSDNIKQFGKKNNKLHPNVWIGYRYQNSGDLLLKLGIAIYAKDINHYVVLPGISLGVTF